MITVLIFIVIGIIVSIYSLHTNYAPIMDDILAGVLGFLGGAIAGLVLAMIMSLFPPKNMVLKETTPIVAFNDHVGTHGDFFLGCGYIEKTMYYFYYKQNPNGSYSADKIETDRVEIFEDSTSKPCILTYNKVCANKFGKLFCVVPQINCVRQIIVPSNAIHKNFTFDLN